jgi:dihydropteroate synthase
MTAGVARIGGLLVGVGQPVRVMGVINVSPESFFPGSVRRTPEEVAETAAAMVEAGAEIIDVGGMSSAPYKEVWVSEDVEVERLRWAVRAVRDAVDVPVSADTFRARAAEAALREGAEMVNDVTGLRNSPEIAVLVKEYSASLIVMANDVGGDVDVMEGVLNQLKASLETAERHGVEPDRVVIDPGVGFHRRHAKKWYVVDGEIVRRLGELRVLGRPGMRRCFAEKLHRKGHGKRRPRHEGLRLSRRRSPRSLQRSRHHKNTQPSRKPRRNQGRITHSRKTQKIDGHIRLSSAADF